MITVAGLGRSGHNAILGWLQAQGIPAQEGLLNLGFDAPNVNRSEYNIFVIRDLRNWIASRHKNDKSAVHLWPFSKIWKQQAEHTISSEGLWTNGDFWCVFDRWFADEAYRRTLLAWSAAKTGKPNNFTDAGLQDVAKAKPWSGEPGSSFDGLKYDGKAQEMGVLHRWTQIKWTDELKKIAEPLYPLNDQLQNLWEKP